MSKKIECRIVITGPIREIGGMTMNERLFNFGLLETWDRSPVADQGLIRHKLGAA